MSMPIAAAMAQLIKVREDLMVDECTVTRTAKPNPTAPLNPATGLPATPDPEIIYSGPCTVADPKDAPQGGRTVQDDSGVPNERVLRVPHRAELRPGDEVKLTSSMNSPGLVGDWFLIVGEEERSFATYRRYIVRGSSWLPTDI